MKVRVVLMDSDNFAQHASGYVDADKISDHNGVERNKRLYCFNKIQDSVVYFVEVEKQPYVITEW